MHTATTDRHSECSFHQGMCEVGDPDHCDRVLAQRKRQREKTAGAWSALELRDEDMNGRRHHLDGEPIHCGEFIELQAIEYKRDDYGEYTVHKQEGVLVRYEASLHSEKPVVTLHAGVKGHEFVSSAEPWMRFRWPKKNG